MAAHVIALSSGKGGVGKTTTAVNLACSLAQGTKTVIKKKIGNPQIDFRRGGRRVLVIDMDRQQSAGDALGIRGVQDRTTYGMALAGEEVDLEECTFRSDINLARGYVDVMPTTPFDYELAASSMTSYPQNGLMAVSAITQAVEDFYDYIVLDLRPELSHYTSSAMVAATSGIIVPVTSEATTAVHLFEMQDHFNFLSRETGQEITSLGVLRTRWDGKGEEGRIVNELLEQGDLKVFDTIIPDHRIVSKSFILTTGPVVTSYPKSPATQRFHEFTAEVVQAVEGDQ